MTRNVAHLLRGEAVRGAAFAVLLLIATIGAILGCALLSAHSSAYADDEKPDYQKTALELQREIEARQADLAAASEEAQAAQTAIDETQSRIDELEKSIPAQQERSAAAVREQYKLQQQSAGIVDMLLSSGSLGEFIDSVEYANRVSDANLAEMNRLQQIKDEISETQNELRESQQAAEARASDARTALAAAQEAQAEVQRRIEEEARQQAELARRAAELAAQERKNDTGEPVAAPANQSANDERPSKANSTDESKPDAGQADESAQEQPAAEQAETEAAPAAEAPEPAAADMPSDEAAFVSEWSARIDAYLAGSPLAGQGTTFAKAAYEYGVDPRFSPAISFTESGKGAVCFLPHNAWGWGSSSWGSWEEAIYAHVAGLASGYGGQISEAAAQKYCPPTWQSWYNRTLDQMNQI